MSADLPNLDFLPRTGELELCASASRHQILPPPTSHSPDSDIYCTLDICTTSATPSYTTIIMTKATPKSATAPKPRTRQKSTTGVDNTKRKRELDRIAQRNCRERTKNRISFLEAKVRSLEQRDANSQFSSLVATQETLLNESTELRAAMRKILFIAGSMVNKSETDCRIPLMIILMLASLNSTC